MDILFRFTDTFGIMNVGLCIILFTIVMKMLMLPLTIKQQKTTKLMAVISPEVQAIQRKYKGKTDTASQQKQNVEIQAVYDKYGTSMTSGGVTTSVGSSSQHINVDSVSSGRYFNWGADFNLGSLFNAIVRLFM